MKFYFTTLLLLLSAFAIYGQELNVHEDYPSEIRWPFLWDISSDAEGNLYTVSELGTLFIKSNDVWEELDLNANSSENTRGVTVDSDGTIWVAANDGLYSIENGMVSNHYTIANSGLPSDELKDVKAHENELWIVLDGNGLVHKQGNQYTHFTKDNSPIGSNYLDDIDIEEDGTLVVGVNEHVSFYNGTWTTYNFNDLFNFSTWVQDIFIDHNQDIWFATTMGMYKYIKATADFEDLQTKYGNKSYSAVIYTPDEKLWLGELFEGLHYFDRFNSFYFDGGSGVPSQVFEFRYFQDTLRFVGNVGATVTGLTIQFLDADMDGFTSEFDCNDADSAINPDAQEIEGNGVDENCDGNDFVVSTHNIGLSVIEIYPNPTSNYINVINQSNLSLKLKLYDASGKLIQDYGNVNRIDISNFVQGVYLLEVFDTKSSKKVIEKIVKYN